jgi:acetyl esterase/lipase
LARPDAGEPPAIVFNGTEDQLLPIGSPAELCPLAHQAGIACEYIGYQGAGHEVGDASRQSDIIRRGTDFLAEHVLGPQGHLDAEGG